jgi:hypothetical protein
MEPGAVRTQSLYEAADACRARGRGKGRGKYEHTQPVAFWGTDR